MSSVASPSGRSRARRRWCTATARTIRSLFEAWATPALLFSTTPRQCCYPITTALSASSVRISSDAPSNPSFCATIALALHCSQWPPQIAPPETARNPSWAKPTHWRASCAAFLRGLCSLFCQILSRAVKIDQHKQRHIMLYYMSCIGATKVQEQ